MDWRRLIRIERDFYLLAIETPSILLNPYGLGYNRTSSNGGDLRVMVIKLDWHAPFIKYLLDRILSEVKTLTLSAAKI
jgi:hypothetical protein